MGFAPDLAPLIALAFITALILLLSAYKATVSPVIQWLVRNIPDISLGFLGLGGVSAFGWLKSALVGFDNTVYASIGALLEGQHWVWSRFVHWNAYAWDKLSGALEEVAVSAEQAIGRVIRHHLPTLIAAALGPLALLVYSLRSQVAGLWHRLAAVAGHTEAVIVHEVRPTVVRVEHLTTTVYRDVPVAVATAGAVTRPRIGELEHDLSEAWDRLRRLGRALTPAGIAGLVGAAIFSHFDLGWLRCRGVNTVGRKLCGLSGLIEQLALDAVDALALLDLCWLIEEAVTAAAPISAVVTEYGNGLNALLRCRGIKPPPGPPITASALPKPWAQLTFGRSAP